VSVRTPLPTVRGIVTELESIDVLVASRRSLFREALLSSLVSDPRVAVVAECDFGPTAVTEAARAKPDVALLDASLPPYGGPKCVSLIIDAAPACRVLLLADDDASEVLVDAFDAGASGLLTKSASVADLLEAIHEVRRGDVVVPRSLLAELIRRLVARRRDREGTRALLDRLTTREHEVLALLASGADNRAIATTLFISPLTARTHVQNVLRKLRVHSRLEAAMFWTQHVRELRGVQ
jgi:two-component system, NarL family, nitrate/nitrite response regulator NarL